jgi:molybdopterin molybdotransferase
MTDEHTYSATSTNTRSILPADMISVEEARTRILQQFVRLDPIEVPLLDAVGQVVATDVVATFNIPPLANTAMDGYAVRAADTAGATYDTPLQLDVIGYLPAGEVFDGEVGPNQSVRIMTGAPIPNGADSVVPFEETDEYGDNPTSEQDLPEDMTARTRVRIDVEARPGANVRPAGEDIKDGETVIPDGAVIGPAQVGVLASLGLDRIPVYRRPVVAILSTGDELLRPGEPLQPGKIYDSNAFSLAAQVQSFGGIPRVLEVARDTVEALTARIHEGLADADLLVTSAGVSRGDFDVVKTVLANEGEVGFWTVKMKPGKPLAFGAFRGANGKQVPHLGLPGNPVSAMLTFELFGRAAIFKMLGKEHAWPRPLIRATAKDRIRNTDGRRFYARVILSEEDQKPTVSLTGPQSSGILTSMALASAFAICPEDTESIEPGDQCDVILVDRERALYGAPSASPAPGY